MLRTGSIGCCAGVLVCAVGALLPAKASAVQPDALLYERLFTDCNRVAVLVGVEDEAPSLGLTEPKRLQTMAESRLRAARLYEPEAAFPSLDIVVEVVGGDPVSAYALRVEFVRPMLNPLTERPPHGSAAPPAGSAIARYNPTAFRRSRPT